jgi:phytoene dehydrogenase-like protein
VRWLDEFMRQTLSSARAWSLREFTGRAVDRLWTPWALHLGLAPDDAGKGIVVPLLAGSTHTVGLPVVVGGSRNILAAFERLLHERGVEVHTGTTATAIDLKGRIRTLQQ